MDTYQRVYKYTNKDNTSFNTQSITVNKSSFKLDTAASSVVTDEIGKILKIEVRHYHTATKSSTPKNWSLSASVVSASSEYKSDIVTNGISGQSKGNVYINTITEDSANDDIPVDIMDTWTGVKVSKELTPPPNSDLYWRASTGSYNGINYEFVVTFTFILAKDMIHDEDNPTVGNSLGVSDGTIVTGGMSAMQYFGNPVQSKSLLTLTTTYTIDTSFEYISATHTLELVHENSLTEERTVLFSGEKVLDSYGTQQIEGHCTFTIPAENLSESGTLKVHYTVTDNGGLSASTVYDLPVLAYSKPFFDAVPVVERWGQDIEGTHVQSADGTNLWLTINAHVENIAHISQSNINHWNLTCYYASDDGETVNSVCIYDSSVDSTKQFTVDYSRDESAFSGRTFDSAHGWSFYFTITDIFGSQSVSETVYIDEATGILNVYPDGVSVGELGSGTPSDKLFQVAQDFRSWFKGLVQIDGGLLLKDFSDGDTITFTGGTFCGYVTNSTKRIIFIIPMHKSLRGVTSATVTELVANIANSGGYGITTSSVDGGSSYMGAAITRTVNIYQDRNAIEIVLERNTAWDLTNNNNLNVRCGTITIEMHTSEST